MSLKTRLVVLLMAIVLAWVLLAGLHLLAPRWAKPFEVDTGHVAAVPVAGGDFELSGQAGPWKLSRDAAGKSLALVYFGFTRCPDLCPTTLGEVASALAKLTPAERARVVAVFVSVDWRSDTPQNVGEYARHFGPEFVGLTGTQRQIDEIVARFDAFYRFKDVKGSAMKYTVIHSGEVYFVRPTGEVVDQVLPDVDDPALLEHLRKHL